MSALKKLDVMIRANSTISQDDAVQWTKNWLNNRQEADTNKDEDGNYLEDFFADLFDSRDNSLWKVFSDVATFNRNIENKWTTKDGETIKGVIYTFSESIVLDMASQIIKYKIENIKMNENPFIYNEDYKFIIAETDNELAELRVENNKVYAFDAGAFAEEKQLLDVKKNVTNLKLIIFK